MSRKRIPYIESLSIMSSRSSPASVAISGMHRPRRVVGQPDVAAELLATSVQGRPHEAEVLLRGVGAGVPLAGGALGHVVEQRLPGRADHRDDVGALAGRGLGLRDVLVDVAGGDDQVDPRPLRRVAEAADQPVALGPLPVDACVCRAPTARRVPSPGRGSRRCPPGAGTRPTRSRPSGPGSAGPRPRRGAGRPRPGGRRRARARRRPRTASTRWLTQGTPLVVGAGQAGQAQQWRARPRRWCGVWASLTTGRAGLAGQARGPGGRSAGSRSRRGFMREDTRQI